VDLKGIVGETYGSVHEIKDITQDILIAVSKRNVQRYKEKGEFDYFEGVHMRDVQFKKRPTELITFAHQANIHFSFIAKEAYGITDKEGYYSGNMEHSRTSMATIVCYYDHADFKPEMDELVKRKDEELDYQDIYFKIYYKFTTTLMHELQHAWDDFRSRGKAYKTKQYQSFLSKYKDDPAYDKLDQEKAAYKFKEYLNLPHEIWARFTQTFQHLHFTTFDIVDGDRMVIYMKPLKEIVKRFTYEMPHFRLLQPDQQQRLLKAVVSYWHKEKDRVDAEQKASKQPIQEAIKNEVEVDFNSGQIKYNGEAAGVVEISKGREDFMILDKIVVYPEFRGQGIGTAAMKHVMEYARSQGKILTLTPDSVHGGNVNRLKRWYQSLGFVLNKGKNKDFRTMQLFYLPLS
jgi:GNAT superfamily N-acetyltransferase